MYLQGNLQLVCVYVCMYILPSIHKIKKTFFQRQLECLLNLRNCQRGVKTPLYHLSILYLIHLECECVHAMDTLV